MYRRSLASLLIALSVAGPASAMDFTTGLIIYGAKKMLPDRRPAIPEPPKKGAAGDSMADGEMGGRYRAAFSPGSQGEALILSELARARRSILVAAPLLASRKMADSLIAALKRGVKVMVLADARANGSRSSILGILADAGVPCRVSDKYGGFSHRFIIIDGRDLILAGFQLTDSAPSKEAASALILDGAKDLAASFGREWLKIWRESLPVSPARDRGVSLGPAPRLRSAPRSLP